MTSHRVYHGYIFDTETAAVIDEVLVIPMLAPRSYTAEDVVEIQSHAGSVVLHTILDMVLAKGARLAAPGEFTKRAFLSGRIDLTQAEAVADIINARSGKSLKAASSQGMGRLREKIENMRSALTEMLTRLEASIDFPDDVATPFSRRKAAEKVALLLEECRRQIRISDDACFIREGIKLAICGPPNAGKSSLMNRLLEKERSIVTPVSGTTRDPVQESININGIPFIISDTAGIHSTDDLVEIIGMEKAKEHINDADIVIYMKEAGRSPSEMELERVIPSDKKAVFAASKTDLYDKAALPEMPAGFQHIPCIGISVKEDKTIDALRKLVITISEKGLEANDTRVVPNLRHKEALKAAAASLESLRKGINDGMDETALAMDVKSGIESLGKITGETAEIDILENIFSNFCIGK